MNRFMVAGGLLALLSHQAQATASTTVIQSHQSMTGLSYTLTDLDESDGVTPYLRQFVARSGIEIFDITTPTVFEHQSAPLGNLFGTAVGGATSASGQASVTQQGNNLESNVKIDAAAVNALPSVDAAPPYFGGKAGTDISAAANWVLAPHSQVTVSGFFQSDFQLDTAQLSSLATLDDTTNLAIETSSFFVIGLISHYPEADRFSFHLEGKQIISSAGILLSQISGDAVNQPFSITFKNDTDVEKVGEFNIESSIQASWSLAPIPEPGTWLLMSLGLGGIAWRERARVRARSRQR